jgi:hypothetical protein
MEKSTQHFVSIPTTFSHATVVPTTHRVRMKHYRELVLICDGYDESQQIHNLYMSYRLNQPGEWDVQMEICCRSEYFAPDYRDRFQPGNRNHQLDSLLIQQAVITPFSRDQLKITSISMCLSVYKPQWCVKDYVQALDLIPSLEDLVKNSFLMGLSLVVLPRMVYPGQHLSSARITRVLLYDHFIEQWLERGKRRLSEKGMSPQTREYFEKLCNEGFSRNGVGYIKKYAVAITRNKTAVQWLN